MTESEAAPPFVVLLQDVVAEMDVFGEETAYLNRHTGELITLTKEEQSLVDDDDDPDALADWTDADLARIRQVLESGDYLALPDKEAIHEHRLMERFSLKVEDQAAAQSLLSALKGSGALRKFRDTLLERGMEQAWNDYRDRALEDLAVQWLEDHGIAYRR